MFFVNFVVFVPLPSAVSANGATVNPRIEPQAYTNRPNDRFAKSSQFRRAYWRAKSVTMLCRNGTRVYGNLPNSEKRGGTASCSDAGVIWFYERRGEHLRCEIRQLIEGDRFALVVTMPDGSERTELFDDGALLNRRSLELEKMLTEKGWTGPYARDI